MTELSRDETDAQPVWGRVFLSHRGRVVLPNFAAHLIFWPLMASGLILDLWSKKAVFEFLQHQQYRSVSIINGFLRLTVAENPGAAFGIAAGQRYLLVAVSIVAIIVILGVFFFGGTDRKSVVAALALFAAGVCGNLYDRIFNDGLVRDFIDVMYWPGKHWPAFNVADSMLCIGVGLMIISGFFTGKSGQRHAR